MSECEDEIARILRLIDNGWDPDRIPSPPDEDVVRAAMERYRERERQRPALDVPTGMSRARDWEGVSPEPIEGTVYYARTCCRIKIGFTTDMERRMAELSPDEILATEPGTMQTERDRHCEFADHHIRGEWFVDAPAIRAHIRALNLGHDGDRRVDTEAAERWTGRDRMVLYRWAREGRVTRHHARTGSLLWDLFELPQWDGTGSPPPPPPKKSKKS